MEVFSRCHAGMARFQTLALVSCDIKALRFVQNT